jgi:Fe-S cluster assembly protein SufD
MGQMPNARGALSSDGLGARDFGQDPSWLKSVRRDGWQKFESLTWEDLDREAWRYLKPEVFLRDFSEEVLHGSLLSSESGPEQELAGNPFPFVKETEQHFEIVWLEREVEGDCHPSPLPTQNSRNLRVLDVSEIRDPADIAVAESLFCLPQQFGTGDRFHYFHQAVFQTGLLIDIPDEFRTTKPLILTQSLSGGVTVCLVRVGRGASVSFLENLGSRAEPRESSTHHVRLIVLLEDGAEMTFAGIQEARDQVKVFQHHQFFVKKNSRLESVYLPVGGRIHRIEQWVNFVSEGASAHTHGLIFGHQHQMFDFESKQNHLSPNTQSQLFFRNVVTDHAKAIFIGNVYIDAKAKGTRAFQTNKNLLLSDTSEAVSTPKLEIDTEDVQCGHGATVATLNEEEIFYLQARGIPRQTAKRMIIQGFLADIVDKLPEGELRNHVRHTLEARLTEVLQ